MSFRIFEAYSGSIGTEPHWKLRKICIQIMAAFVVVGQELAVLFPEPFMSVIFILFHFLSPRVVIFCISGLCITSFKPPNKPMQFYCSPYSR